MLAFIYLGRRRVFMSPATFSPTGDRGLQQDRNAAMWLQDLGIETSYMIHDRDIKYLIRFDQFWKWAGIRILKTSVQAPTVNSFVECYIGKCKRDCLNYFVCVSLDQLSYINREWSMCYNNHRPHQEKEIGNKVLCQDFTPTARGEIKRE